MSHSSVERIVLADSLILAYYMTKRFLGIVDGMVVDRTRMRATSTRRTGSCSARPVLLALVEAGLAHDDAYRLVQRGGDATWESRRPFRECSRRTRRSPTHLSPERSTRASIWSARSRTRLAPSTRSTRRTCRESTSRCRTTTPARCASSTRSTTTGCSSSRPTASRCSTSCCSTTDPRQGTGAHRRCRRSGSSDRVHRGPTTWCRPTPPTSPRPRAPRSPGGRCSCARRGRCASSASRAGYLFGSAWSDYEETGTVQGRPLPSRAAPGRAAPAADLHAHHQGRVGPRPPALRRRRRRARGRRPSSSRCASSRCGSTSSAPSHAASRGPDPRRHQARVRHRRRRAARDRRDAHARLVALLAGRGLPRWGRRRRRSTSSTCATTTSRSAGTSEPPAPRLPQPVIDGDPRRSTWRPTSSSPARASTSGTEQTTREHGVVEHEVRGPHRRDAPAGRPRPAGRDRRAGAPGARVRQRRARSRSRKTIRLVVDAPSAAAAERRSTRCAGGCSRTP